ncbi:MAG: PLP-dependent transferase [Pseudomonadota bacterium]
MSKRTNSFSLDTLMAQAGGTIDPVTGGVVPPIQSSTTFVRDEDYVPFSPDHIYARDQNDLARLAESLLAKAEGAEAALLLPSGMAAAVAVLRTLRDGDRLIMQSGIYWGVTAWTRNFCERRNIDLVEVDCSDLDALKAVGGKAQMIWIETPSNPYLKTTDIAACADIAKTMGATLAVDSTAATPVHSQPLSHGADIVMHSATKGINGHSDVLAGALATSNPGSDIWQEIAVDRHGAGAVIGSFEAWLLIRGMRTLPLRARRMAKNAQAVAEFLATHDAVKAVLYPGLSSDPGHATAKRQMQNGFGGLLSFQLKGGREAAHRAVGRMELFKRATSLGGVESLVEHRHIIEEAVPDNLLRLSCGIEDSQNLVDDLNHALT